MNEQREFWTAWWPHQKCVHYKCGPCTLNFYSGNIILCVISTQVLSTRWKSKQTIVIVIVKRRLKTRITHLNPSSN